MSSDTVNVVELPQLHGSSSPKATRLGHRLDLIEQLKVRVNVIVGSTELPVGKLFSLGEGDVLALDQHVDSPVELHLNEKLIARGRLVASGDRLGIRITELFQE